MSPLPFSFVGFQPLSEGFSCLGFWLSGHWPYLLFLALVGLAVILVRSWSWLLDWEGGRWWPVPASILPAMIPITRGLEENAPSWVRGLTLAVLLVTIAVLQTYGQGRNNRDRIKTEDRITEQKNLLTEQTNLLIASINEAREGREEAERRTERTEALLGRIADGITTAAAADEEAWKENE